MPWTAADGHECKVEPTRSGRRWVVRCSCGYGAPLDHGNGVVQDVITRTSEAEAVRTAIWHLRTPDREAAKRAEDLRRNGVSTT